LVQRRKSRARHQNASTAISSARDMQSAVLHAPVVLGMSSLSRLIVLAFAACELSKYDDHRVDA
jgi:hypothetical protein